MVMPLREAGGALGGAIGFIISSVGDRHAHPGEVTRPGAGDDDFAAIVSLLGELTGADYACLVEIDPDDRDEGAVLAGWTVDGDAPTAPDSAATIGTAITSVLKSRRLACVVDDGADLLSADPWLAASGFRSCIASALVSSDGRVFGVLAGLWRTSPADLSGSCAVTNIISARAAAVMAHLVTERELKESEQRYGAVFEGSSVPILLIEPGTTQIVDANPAACTFYGYDWDDFVTMSVLQIDALSPETVQAELARAVEGTRARFASKHRAANGVLRDVEATTGSIVVGGRRLLYYMVSDITERLRMEAEIERHQRNLEMVVAQRTRDLLRVNAELQHATVARDMIFASLTQEVRTSLQTITGFSELMLGGLAGALTDEQSRQTAMVLDAGKRLSAFMASLIETQRYDDRELVCEPEPVDLVDLVESVVFGLDSFAADKGLEVRMVAQERPVQVETDRYKVQKILLNLLSNAIRYTERGSVTVTVSQAEDACSISVADTGVGIGPERMSVLFDGPESHEPAAGIGLPSSRRVAEAIGATIDAESVEGRGSTFTLRLPRVCDGCAVTGTASASGMFGDGF